MHMPFIYTFIMFHLAFSPSLTIKNFLVKLGLSMNRTPSLLRNGKGWHTVLSFKDRSGWTVSLTCGKENTPTAASLQKTTSLPRERMSNSTTTVEGKSASSMTWTTDSAGTGFQNPSWEKTRYFFCLRHSYETSINSSWEDLTQRSSDSKQQAASRRLSSSSSLVYCSTLSLQKKKFLENLLHFLHPSEKPVVFTRDFGCRIGCRIRCRM